jgi:hypothetical protein
MEKNAFSMQRMRENARILPMRDGSGWKRKVLFILSIFGTAFCITCLYHGMRGIMRLGMGYAAFYNTWHDLLFYEPVHQRR